MKRFHFQNGRVIDPSRGLDTVGDIWVEDGRIVHGPLHGSFQTIDCRDRVICPGLIDLHVHFREPGQSAKETIQTGSHAAAAGGFTTVVMMPNTSPVADAVNTITWMIERATSKAVIRCLPTGCISQGMKGEVLAPIGSLKKAGVVAITDDGQCVQSNELMRRAMEYCRMFDLPILDHCQDASLSAGGVMHEGYWSTLLGLRGWPALAEEVIVSRNAILAAQTGARVHCQHLSCAGSVRILREARRRGVPISGEVCPHHIALTDACLETYDSNYKVNPPLRTQEDINALLEGLSDGTIEILASDHAPHCSYEKEVELDDAPCGVVGLETELGIFIDKLVHGGVLTLPQLIEKLTTAPARLLGLKNTASLRAGMPADITVIDPNLVWQVDSAQFLSKGRNTPFQGWRLKGRAVLTMMNGSIVWSLEKGIQPCA